MRITLCVVLCLLSAGCLEATKGIESKKEPQPSEFVSNTLIIESMNSSYRSYPYYELRLSGVIRNNSQFTLKGVRLVTEIYEKDDAVLGIGKDDCDPGILEPNTSGKFDIGISLSGGGNVTVKIIPQCDLGNGETFIKEATW